MQDLSKKSTLRNKRIKHHFALLRANAQTSAQ